MYFEVIQDPQKAADRERQIKKYGRQKKIALFAKSNPEWKDLSAEIPMGILTAKQSGSS